MSNISAFLKPAYTEKKVEIIVGDRFNDEEGNPVPIVMKSLTQEQLNSIAKRCMKEKKVGGKIVQELDAEENLNKCLVASIVFPDLTNEELCRAYGTLDPSTLPPKMFLISEYTKLAQEFAILNGLKDDDDSYKIPGEVSKN